MPRLDMRGQRAAGSLHSGNQRADASTLSVINNIKRHCHARCTRRGGYRYRCGFEFDQSPYVTRAVGGVVIEGLLGAGLVGLMILIFLQDWRMSDRGAQHSLALMSRGAIAVADRTNDQSMTLGGLALAIGILVDEATVAIENIHAHLQRGQPLAEAVRDGSAETAIPRLLAMLCILAVFVSAFFMRGRWRCSYPCRWQSASPCWPRTCCPAHSCRY